MDYVGFPFHKNAQLLTHGSEQTVKWNIDTQVQIYSITAIQIYHDSKYKTHIYLCQGGIKFVTVYLFVCPSVCSRDYSNTTCPIILKRLNSKGSMSLKSVSVFSFIHFIVWIQKIINAGTELCGKPLVDSRASKLKKLLALTKIQWPLIMHKNALVDVICQPEQKQILKTFVSFWWSKIKTF